MGMTLAVTDVVLHAEADLGLIVEWAFQHSGWIFFLLGPIVYTVVHRHYRNPDARHEYESATKATISETSGRDRFLEHRKETTHRKLPGANDHQLLGGGTNSAPTPGRGVLRGLRVDHVTQLQDGGLVSLITKRLDEAAKHLDDTHNTKP